MGIPVGAMADIRSQSKPDIVLPPENAGGFGTLPDCHNIISHDIVLQSCNPLRVTPFCKNIKRRANAQNHVNCRKVLKSVGNVSFQWGTFYVFEGSCPACMEQFLIGVFENLEKKREIQAKTRE